MGPSDTALRAYLNTCTTPQPDGHWTWTGPVETWGNGTVTPRTDFPGYRKQAARGVIYRVLRDPAADMFVKQGCNEPLCVNPDHARVEPSPRVKSASDLAKVSNGTTGPFGETGTLRPKESKRARIQRETLERALVRGNAAITPIRSPYLRGPVEPGIAITCTCGRTVTTPDPLPKPVAWENVTCTACQSMGRWKIA